MEQIAMEGTIEEVKESVLIEFKSFPTNVRDARQFHSSVCSGSFARMQQFKWQGNRCCFSVSVIVRSSRTSWLVSEADEQGSVRALRLIVVGHT